MKKYIIGIVISFLAILFSTSVFVKGPEEYRTGTLTGESGEILKYEIKGGTISSVLDDSANDVLLSVSATKGEEITIIYSGQRWKWVWK